MDRFRCQYYNGYFCVEKVSNDKKISSLDKEIFADSLEEAIHLFMAYCAI